MNKSMSRVEELNERIRSRNIGDTPPFYFSPRPVATKYTTMPVVDERVTSTVPIRCGPVFDVSSHFLPGTSAPICGKLDKIDIETDLYRPKDYVPDSSSSLYKKSIPSTESMQPFPLLFASVRTNQNGIRSTIPDKRFFQNDTRIKNIY